MPIRDGCIARLRAKCTDSLLGSLLRTLRYRWQDRQLGIEVYFDPARRRRAWLPVRVVRLDMARGRRSCSQDTQIRKSAVIRVQHGLDSRTGTDR